jgi:hypothetical protein
MKNEKALVIARCLKERDLWGLYVGGYAHPYAKMQIDSEEDWPLAYWREWVLGDSAATIPSGEKTGLLGLYRDAVREFPD